MSTSPAPTPASVSSSAVAAPGGTSSSAAGLPPAARRHGPDPRLDLPVARSPVTLDDLLEGLLWPKLLRSAALALGPSRLLLSTVLVVTIFALDRLWGWMFSSHEPGPLQVALMDLRRPAANLLDAILPSVHGGIWAWSPDFDQAGRAILDLFITVPRGMIVSAEGTVVSGIFASIILLPVALLLAAIAGGAICRSVVVEVATGQIISLWRSVRFAWSRWGSLVGALAGPIVVVWAIGLVLLAAGWLMRWPVLNIAGGLVFFVLLLLSLLAAVIMAAYVLGHMMLLPAVAAEGADGFDAIQRAYAYVYGRPLRLIIYLAILLVQGIVAFLLLGSLVSVALALAEQATGVDLAAGAPAAARIDERATYWLVAFWIAVVKIVTLSYAISLYFSGGTMLYLLMRRLNDDQDLREIWMPGMLEGTRTTAAAATIAQPAPTAPAASGVNTPPSSSAAGAPANPDPADYA